MQAMIVQGIEFSNSDYGFTKPKVLSSGGKSVGVVNSGKVLTLSTPLMTTWGLSDYEGNQKFEFSLQYPTDEYSDAETESFLTNMKAFEESIKVEAIKNSMPWFGKKSMSKEVIDALWSPMLKYSKYPKGHANEGEFDYDRPPRLQVKVPFYDGIWKAELYDDNNHRLFPNVNEPTATPLDFITKGTKVATLIQCGGIWFANGKFGVTWKLVQAVIKPRETLFGRCHISLSSADKERLKVAEEVEQDLQEAGAAADTAVESDEEEEEEVVVPVVEPKKKKVVRKKAVTSEV
jgi:hypothetical protein